MSIDISIQGSATKHPRINHVQETIQACISPLFRVLELQNPELSLVLTDNDEIKQLNAQWRGEDVATDVLSFPLYEFDELPEEIYALGDIVISIEYAEAIVDTHTHRNRIALELGIDPQDFSWSLIHEVTFLFIHGLLHLLGHDHFAPDEEALMKQEEKRLWQSIAHCLPPA